MNLTDILILAGILVFVLLGFRDGFFKKIFGILGFLGGLICATKFVAPLADYLNVWIGIGGDAAVILAFFSVFVVAILLVNLLYRWFGESGNDTLKYWSRLAGGFLGAAQGAVAVSLILIMFQDLDLISPESRRESLLFDSSVKIAPRVFDYMTRWMPTSKKFDEELKDIREKLEKYK